VPEKIMVHAILLCCVILGDGGKPADSSASDRAAYDAAAAKAGKNAAAHVKLALWCETHGLSSERIKHLSIAASLDPSNVLSHGLLGLIAFQGKWAKPDQVEKEIHEDPKLQALVREYLDRRVRTPPKNVDAQLRLAAWCLENGLKDEAMAHYHLVTKLDPSRDIAWVRLGYKKHHDRWSKPEVLAAHKLEAEHQKHADKEWKLRLEKLHEAMESPVEARRLKAERELYQVTDPRALPMIWKIFGHGSEKMQLVAVELLSQIEGPAASFGLAVLAVEKPSADVRSRAAKALTNRDPRDVIGWLVAAIHRPFKYEIKPGAGGGTTGELFVDGERFDIRRIYRFPDIQMSLVPPEAVVWNAMLLAPTPAAGQPGNRAAAAMTMSGRAYAIAQQQVAMAIFQEGVRRDQIVQQKLESDVETIEQVNAQIRQTDDCVLPLLQSLTGQNFGADPQAWQTWWADQLGVVLDDRYAAQSKPTFTDFVSLADLVPHHACFAAGTLVQTFAGPRKIEAIALGDRVLSQDTGTGALSFQPVLATHVNGPADTLRISAGGETIVATGIHRFWKAGKGWTMARDLSAGDRLRMIGGVVTVESIEPGPSQKVYNLDVARNRDFLVGSSSLLVHDFSFVEPVAEPFDRQTNLAPAAAK
jgi:tetratricopeptide (TPR) repeat protein